MSKGLRRQGPAMAIACVALFATLGGSVYAASKSKRINGKTMKVTLVSAKPYAG